MKEWDAPESNKTEAGVELTRNIPSTTLGSLGRLQHQRASPCLVRGSAVPCWSVGSDSRSSSAASASSALVCVEGSSLGKRWHSDQALRT
jgi:hypothetical protein